MTSKRSNLTYDFGLSEVEVGCQELRDRLKRSAHLRHLLEVYPL